MPECLRPSDSYLRELLAAGPRNSREVLAAMVDREFSPKQVRRARERQGILAERAGRGKTMHTIWRLPDPGLEAAPESLPAIEVRFVAPVGNPASATDEEHRRHGARVAAFIEGGLDALVAVKVADKLVARDREGSRAVGSCAECQSLALRQCPVTPRPVIEVHQCWYRRQGSP